MQDLDCARLTLLGMDNASRYNTGIMYGAPHLCGTGLYSSPNQEAGKCYTRRDDLEALAHVLIDLALGALPWIHCYKAWDIRALKKRSTPDTLCSGLPEVFAEFLTYTRAMKLKEQPDYETWIDRFNMVLYESKHTL